jgi:hypothetical protein
MFVSEEEIRRTMNVSALNLIRREEREADVGELGREEEV